MRLFSAIRDNQVNKFFRLQVRQHAENKYWAYDSTSISSYSETLSQVQHGKNKEDAIKEARRYLGYFVLILNEKMMHLQHFIYIG